MIENSAMQAGEESKSFIRDTLITMDRPRNQSVLYIIQARNHTRRQLPHARSIPAPNSRTETHDRILTRNRCYLPVHTGAIHATGLDGLAPGASPPPAFQTLKKKYLFVLSCK